MFPFLCSFPFLHEDTSFLCFHSSTYVLIFQSPSPNVMDFMANLFHSKTMLLYSAYKLLSVGPVEIKMLELMFRKHLQPRSWDFSLQEDVYIEDKHLDAVNICRPAGNCAKQQIHQADIRVFHKHQSLSMCQTESPNSSVSHAKLLTPGPDLISKLPYYFVFIKYLPWSEGSLFLEYFMSWIVCNFLWCSFPGEVLFNSSLCTCMYSTHFF